MNNMDTSDVLLNRGLNGGYYGGRSGYSGNLGQDGSAIKASLDSSFRANEHAGIVGSINNTQAQRALSDQMSSQHSALGDSVVRGNEFLTDRISAQSIDAKFANVDRALIAGFASAERLAFSNQAATIAQLHAMELKQTECCCELKAGQASILAKIESDRLVEAQQVNQTLRTEILINNQGRVGNP